MANGYFERGEIYWVKYGDSLGAEEAAGRPGVIVSSNKGNNSSQVVNVVLLTKQRKNLSINVFTRVNGIERWVLVNQIVTVDKTRLSRCEGKLSAQEMKEVDDALEEVFDLGYVDDAALKAKDAEIAERNGVIGVLKAEAAETAAKIQKKDEEIASLKMEIEMWQKCYGRCMDMLVDVKVNADLNRRTVAPVTVAEPTNVVDPKEPVIAPKQPEEPPKPLDINTATFAQLRGIGLSSNIVLAIIDKRPYKKVEELKNAPGMNAQKYNIISKKICCVPVARPKSALVEKDPGYEVVEEPVVTETPVVEAVKPKMVDINVATAEEISEITGIHRSTCNSITGYRNKNGPYKKLEDLLPVHGVYPGTLEKCWDKIVISGVQAEKPIVNKTRMGKHNVRPEGRKVNVNTATAQEIYEISGLNINACYAITGKRKRDGLFKTLEELIMPPRITASMLENYRPWLEV